MKRHQVSINRFYTGQAGSRYDHAMEDWEVPGARKDLIDSLGIVEGSKVLEVCCGTGLNFEYYNHGASYEAVDINSMMLDYAKERVRKMKDVNIKIRQLDIHEHDFKEKLFDAMILTYALSGTPGNKNVLPALTSNLAPDGRIGILDFDLTLQGPSRGFIKLNLRRIIETSGLQVEEYKRHYAGKKAVEKYVLKHPGDVLAST